MYQAFTDAERLITTRVLTTQLSPELLPLAALAHGAAMHDPTWPEDIFQSFLANLSSKFGITSDVWLWNLSEAIPLGELHGHVRFLADDFAYSCLRPWGHDPCSISGREINRIETAFYKLELYRSLLNCSQQYRPNLFDCLQNHKRFFYGVSPPWENEQFACILSYLMNKLTPGKYE